MNRSSIIKLFFRPIFFVLPLIISYPVVNAMEGFDDIDIIDFCDQHMDAIESANWELSRSCDKGGIIVFLNDIKAIDLLKLDFFLRTNNVQNRSLLDYPEYLPWRQDIDKRAVGFYLFYNEMNRGFFTKKSSNVCSYLNILGADYIRRLEEIFQQIKELEVVDLDIDQFLEVLPLFETFTTQERRFGLMNFGKWKYDHWHFYVMNPLYYLERNYFVNEQVQEDLERLITNITGQPANESDAERFQEAHLISDKLGLGDTRIYIDHPIVHRKNWKMRLGGLLTLPTAVAMTRGLKGSSYNRLTCRPELDLCELFDDPLAKADIIEFKVLDYLLASLDNASAMLLDNPMGNGGHVGIGVIVRNKMNISEFINQSWADCLIMRGFYSLEYLIPAWEKRSFRIPADPAEFDRRNIGNEDTPQEINDNFDFLMQELTNRLFPIALNTNVHPGIVFRWVSEITKEYKNWGFCFGTDTWLRTPEHFKDIESCPWAKSCIDRLNAQSPFAYQSKIWGNIFFKFKKPGRNWTLRIGGDNTFMNYGIGEDFTIFFSADVAF